jgi:hypothetical protein
MVSKEISSKELKNGVKLKSKIAAQEKHSLKVGKSSETVEVVVFSHEGAESGVTNPGHVGLKIGNTLYNYGRYWGHYPYNPALGPGVLRKDNAQTYIAKSKPKRHWIYGFVIAGADVAAIKAHANDKFKAGKAEKGKEGREIDTYTFVFKNCKNFTWDLLEVGGISLPSYFHLSDWPADARDDFFHWNKEHPEVVTSVKTYKADKTK